MKRGMFFKICGGIVLLIISYLIPFTKQTEANDAKIKVIMKDVVKASYATDAIQCYDIDYFGYTIAIPFFSDKEIHRVWFPTWTVTNGQDDIVWLEGSIQQNSNGTTAICHINTSAFQGKCGEYITHIYVEDSSGLYLLDGREVMIPSFSNTIIQNVTITQGNDGYTICANVIPGTTLKTIWFPTWTVANGQDDIVWKPGTISGDMVSCFIPFAEHNGETGIYSTHIYAEDENGYHLLDGKEIIVQGENTKEQISLLFPLQGNYVLTSPFGPRENKPMEGVDSFHHGTDFSIVYGSPVLSAADGVVIYAGDGSSQGTTGCGNQVWISHENGRYMTMYNHLSEINVSIGQNVLSGNRIGAVGQTGLATGPHLDFRIYIPAQYARYDKVNGDYIDPMTGDYMIPTDMSGTRYPYASIQYH